MKFRDHLGKKKLLVFFHGDHCGYCQNVKPTWNSVAKRLKSNKKVQPLSVEAQQIPELSKLNVFNDIQTVPNIVMLDKRGKLVEHYRGKMDKPESIVRWCNNKSLSPNKSLKKKSKKKTKSKKKSKKKAKSQSGR